MRLKKTKGVTLTIGFGALVLSVVLFILIPSLAGTGFDYYGPTALISGFDALLTGSFDNMVFTTVVIFSGVLCLFLIWWLINIFVKRQFKSLITWFFALVFFAITVVLTSTIFLAEVFINGEKQVLFKTIMALTDKGFGQALFIAVIALAYLSFIFIALSAFMDTLTNHMARLAQKKAKEDIKRRAERKEREEAFIAAAVATGEFAYYDEVELSEPLIGFTEEPIMESEEADKLIKAIEEKNSKK